MRSLAGEARRNPAPARAARCRPGVVMPLDVIEVHGVRDRWPLIELAREFHEVRIVGDSADIALEVQVVDRVEPDQRRKQPPVRFRDPGSAKIPAGPEHLLKLIQSVEDPGYRLLVFCLARSEPGAVDAMIDVVVQPFVQRIDLRPQAFRIEIRRLVEGPAVELRIEHPHDVAGVVADDRRSISIP
jgi:hypothetical protein